MGLSTLYFYLRKLVNSLVAWLDDCIWSGHAEGVQIIADWLPAQTTGPGSSHAKELPEPGSTRAERILVSAGPGCRKQRYMGWERSGAGQCVKQANQSISLHTWPHANEQPITTGLHALSLAGEGLPPGYKPVSAHTTTKHALRVAMSTDLPEYLLYVG
jgi:hypothetical protein